MFLIDTFLFIGLFFFLKMLGKIVRLCFKKNMRLLSFIPYLAKINYKNLYQNLKTNILKIGKTFLIATCALIILQYFKMKTNLTFLKFLSNPFLIYLSFFFLQMMFLRTLSKNKILNIIIILGGLLCSLAFIFTNKTIELISIIKNSLLLMLFISLGVQLAYLYIENYEIKNIKIKNLYAGSFLTTKSLSEIKNKIKEQNQEDDLNLIINSDGLSKSQVQVIQKLFKNEPEEELEIYETFSFAPFMFLAFIVSFISKTSFLSFFSYLFHLIK
jgi:hypothetical protein